MKTITGLYEFEDSRITLLVVDDSGKYYIEEGNQGIVRDASHFENSPEKNENMLKKIDVSAQHLLGIRFT